MDTAEIQTRLDAMVVAMAAKGLVRPDAAYRVQANSGPQVCLSWRADSFKTKFVDSLDAADACIAALPSPEEAHRTEFLRLAASAADYAAKHLPGNDIACEVRATIVAGMQRLSDAAITDQRGL